MEYRTLISVQDLEQRYQLDDWLVVDCRFYLTDKERGRSLYLESHIPGAVYAHLEEDLSSAIIPGVTGRHPLPTDDDFVKVVSNWGITDGMQVVVYDDMGGSIAVRLWWMLRKHGHMDVAVLDGGYQEWERARYATVSGEESRETRQFLNRPQPGGVVTTEELLDNIEQPTIRVLDVRKPRRYRGEEEPIDPVAGHIPGAISAPYAENTGEDGKFLPIDELRQRYETMLEGTTPDKVAFYCGSGVTSIQNVFVLSYLGIEGANLYVGSWSQWIADPDRPVATGPNP